jgi:hypothetical protein
VLAGLDMSRENLLCASVASWAEVAPMIMGAPASCPVRALTRLQRSF